MYISQLIFKLEELKQEHGDLPCYLPLNAGEEGSLPIEILSVEKIESKQSEYIKIT